GKFALADNEAGLLNTTGAGPLTIVQVEVTALPRGTPSSLTCPDKDTDPGAARVSGPPALTEGALFPGCTVPVVVALAGSWVSLAVNFSEYVPGEPNVAVVLGKDGSLNVVRGVRGEAQFNTHVSFSAAVLP